MMLPIRKRRSVEVEKPLLNKLSKWYKGFKVKVDAEREIGLDFRVIKNVIAHKSCSPDTKTKIENFFNN